MSPATHPGLAAALSDRYLLQGELGRGGMATVYRALDRKHDRVVALKVLHDDIAATLGARRFLDEIRIVARLAHPHILPLLDSGDAGGILYYAMPLVSGGSLRERLARTPRLPLADAMQVLREVASALEYAHREGYVHRDVKPENILFAEGHAVLADFGIARGGRGREDVTDVGLVLGTPEYMSPEQAAGESTVDGRSDGYSLACIAYEMLAGEPPLRGESPRSTMARQVADTPPPLRASRPDTPEHVDRAIAMGLAKNPADRFASIAAFMEALEAGTGLPARAGAPGIAVLPFVNTSADPDNEYLSDGITEELIDALAKVDGLRVTPRSSVFALKGKPADARAVGAQLGAAWLLEGSVRRAGARLRITAQLSSTADGSVRWSERYDRTLEDVFAIQEEIAHLIVDTLRATSFADLGEPAARPRTRSMEAYSLYLRGRFAWNKRSQEGVSEAIRFFEQAIAADPGYAQAYAGLADAYALQLDYRSIPAAEGFALATTYARQALALDDTVAEAHASLAWSLFIYDWNWGEARREFERAIALDPRYATAHQWFAFLLAVLGNTEQGIAEAQRALELDRTSVSIRRSTGWLYYYARRFTEARGHLERAVAMNPTSDESYRVLGLILAMQGEHAEAERAFREAIGLSEGSYNLAMLGWLLGRNDRVDEARDQLDELSRRAAGGYVSPVAFTTIHLGLGEHELALDWMERALEERRGWMAYLRVNPIVDPLRGLPRFETLARRVGL